MRIKRSIPVSALCILIALSLTSCISVRKVSDEEIRAGFDELCDDIFKQMLEDNSFNAHFVVSDPSEYGVTFNTDDYTLGGVLIDEDEDDDVDRYLDRLHKITRKSLTDEQKTAYDSIEFYLVTQKNYEGLEMYYNYFGPTSGITSNLSSNFIEYVFYDQDDVDHYLEYLKDCERYIDEAVDVLYKQSEKGYFMPEYVADEVIEQCDKILNADTEALIVTFEGKIDGLGLDDKVKDEYIETNKQYVDKYYLPSYEKVKNAVSELKTTGTNDGGLCGFGDDGKALYKAILRDKTSSDMTPEEVIELLEDEINECVKSLTAVIAMDYNAYEKFLDYKAGFDTPDDVLKYIIKEMESDFPAPATTNYNIEYQNKACEVEGTLAYYVSSRIDDISINNIKVNGSEVESGSLMMYETLAHEGYPGHLYEFTNFYDNDNICNARKALNFTGATEGWAKYVESCVDEYLDMSRNVRELNRVNNLISYICSSRVDIGVNYEGWAIDDVYSYLAQYYEINRETATEMFYSAVGDPGVLLPYTVGNILMQDLRDKAEKKLGSGFEALEFHKWILDTGITAFPVYEDRLDDWLAKK